MTNRIDELATGILNGDIKTVRQLLTNDSALNNIRTRNNQFPIELAKSKGLKRIETILLLSSENNLRFYSNIELKHFVGQLISELSEEMYAAGWLDGIENKLWELSNDKTLTTLDNVRVDITEIRELRNLADRLGYWAVWDDNYLPDNVRPIKITDWTKEFVK